MKPPIISDEEVRVWFEKKFGWRALEEWQDQLPHWGEHQREAQRDADVAWLSKEIEKVENPFVMPQSHSYKAFEECRQKILSLLC